MTKISFTSLCLSLLIGSAAQAKSVQVRGYTRANGTYVAPHIRSSPDSVKWNNYGSAKSAGSNYTGGYTSPLARDSDRDGIPNYKDKDDNNNGVSDDNE